MREVKQRGSMTTLLVVEERLRKLSDMQNCFLLILFLVLTLMLNEEEMLGKRSKRGRVSE
jgi:hypothetical protein